jgi:signal transduction histidine kinase
VEYDQAAMMNQLQQLLAEADAIKLRDYTRTIELGEQAFVLANRHGDHRAAAHASYLIAWGHNRLLNFAAAVEPARRSLDLAQRYGYAEEKAYALLCLDAIHAAAGEQSRSLELCEEAYQIAQSLDHRELTVFSLCDMGASLGEAGELEQSMTVFERILTYQTQHGLEPDTMVLVNLGINLRDSGQAEAAKARFEQARSLSRQHGYVEDEISSCLETLNLLLRFEPHDLGIDALIRQAQEAVQTLPASNQHQTELAIYQAEVYIARHQYKLALKILTPLAEHKDDRYHIYDALRANHNLATVYEHLGDYPRALDALRRAHALEARVRAHEAARRAQVLRALYEVEQAQQELAELKRTERERYFKERATREQELQLAKQNIFSRLSHEFRTPLSIIRSSSDLMTMFWDRMPPDERAARRATIDRQYDALERLLDDLRALLKMDTAPLDALVEVTHLDELLMTIRQRSQHPDRVQVNAADHAPLRLPAGIINDVLNRLLTNALTFSSEAVILGAVVEAAEVIFTVTDRGIGIPPGELEAVFEPLVRGSNLNEQPGIGVGLTLARHQAQTIGATVRLESEPEKGTRAFFRVPYHHQRG